MPENDCPAYNLPPHWEDPVFMQVPGPLEVLQVLTIQHWLSHPPEQKPALLKPLQFEVVTQIPLPRSELQVSLALRIAGDAKAATAVEMGKKEVKKRILILGD
jgi:hypothetical protein